MNVLGLDIGGTKLAAGVVDSHGQLKSHTITPTGVPDGPAAVQARLFALGQSALDQFGITTPDAIGVGCGGPLDHARGVLNSPPLLLPGWDSIPITTLAQKAFGAPAFLENDGAAAALGEYQFGAGRGTKTMLYLTISTGIGGGAILAEQLYRGGSDNGCEFGHILVVPDGRLCNCGRRGCIEAYASGTSIANRAREALTHDTPSRMHSLAHPPTSIDVVAAAADGDPLARTIWTETTRLLGSALVDLVNIFEPDRVVLGGGVTGAGELLFEPCLTIVRRDARGPGAAVDIVPSQLGPAVGIIGAAAAAMNRLTH